jgi:hypothetical protein
LGGPIIAVEPPGAACSLLAQIAEELRIALPGIFQAHPLRYFWSFKYDSALEGTRVHTDFEAINANFWITPDEANLDPHSGGLIIWARVLRGGVGAVGN